ncbi:MAG: DNA topoisomerase I [Gammaproteobacteria bacterium RIFCSPHIGHO2_02_FULL_39_13]|nr:MAG: DNA topoisomerase I [Gammaproteobacteria bacterium RIFCSPHIGHO2_02_FULL_39_13]OGT48377.1 MAG: DNA topoisomerase I [Gammaproteobacteria bacterium RIFCSPHIGHO2_12_FULL_39_24]
MPKHLVIVESPAKAKTIEKYLGKDFHVMASYGHVRDLIPKEGAVDPDHDFEMKYQLIERNAKHVDAIRKALKNCDSLYLAPDPDREGEAIAWHIQEILKEKDALKNKKIARVVFHQITKHAVQNAIKNPRDISMDLVNAQQARRALDYLVGFTLSPLLWRKVRPGLSAGRVQSPALRLICEREAEIEKFISQEYWTIHAALTSHKQSFSARLTHYKNKKLEQFDINDEKKSKTICDALSKNANGKCRVAAVTKKERKRHPAAPFTTSTLQQEASRKLGFSAQRTMQVAQQLYEGIDSGEGPVGLITYMRTDSVTLAQEALTDLRDCIQARYGKALVPTEARIYKTKSKNAQEAHEAIRPTSASRIPADIQSFLTPEQFKLYDLIWKRTIASQMIDATLNTVAIDFEVKDGLFRANGSTVVDPGFMTVYEEGLDDKKSSDEESEKILPPLKEGDSIPIESIAGEQHFTEPPPRFTEASLVKSLEEFGIGRPSTYASIIATLKNRDYVEMDNKRFKPTDVGRVVNYFLTKYFTMYVDYHFTAKLEDELDSISCGEAEWIPVLENFWTPFKALTEDVAENVKRSDVTQEPIDEKCPKCEKQLSIRLGKRGRFIGCSGYPDCDYTRNLSDDKESTTETVEGRVCPECESPLIVRHGKYGKFIGCSSYPKCKHIESLEQPEDTKVACPKCNAGQIVKRKSRRGKIFFSCNKYPDCDYAIWYPPVAEKCPQCEWPILMIKTTKTKGAEKMCPQKECGYSVPYEAV